MAIWDKTEGSCLPLDIVMLIMYFLTSVKSVRDLILSEIVYRDTPLLKITWRKFFHILLPISQITLCLCTFFFSTFCVPINGQKILHTILTASSGYIWLLCYLFNALHWAFLTSTSENQKYRKYINALIVFFFIIGPIVLLILISIATYTGQVVFYNIVHPVEIVYRTILDVVVMIVVFVSWYILYSRLRIYAGLHTINSIKKRLTIQMLLYIIFFLFCTVFFIIMGILSFSSTRARNAVRYLFFCSELLGTIPLVFVMLHFLSAGKPANATANADSAASSSSSVAFASGSGSGGGVGGGGALKAPDMHQYYQFAHVNQDMGDVGYMSQQEGFQVEFANPEMYTHPDTGYGVTGYYGMDNGGYGM